MNDTIFALSSGAPPAAIGVIRVSGPGARDALLSLAGSVPAPRRAVSRRLRDAAGDILDRALVLWLPGPATATGDDMAEFHCHGGRAIIAAITAALGTLPGLRLAAPGEFTRRAFTNGRIDLAQAEGLADLLAAETELQRRGAIAMASGAFSREVEHWRERLLAVSAMVEASLDFADEQGETGGRAVDPVGSEVAGLATDLARWLARPRAEPLREGVRVVLAGAPNTGKSTLFNALVGSEAAITAPTAGTTRDLIARPVALDGVPFSLVDTAGIRDGVMDPVEAIGIERARAATAGAAMVLWLGKEGLGPADAWEIEARIDRAGHHRKSAPRHRVSALTGAGLAGLRDDLVATARALLPAPGEAALGLHQAKLLGDAATALRDSAGVEDPLVIAEHLRLARLAFDALLGGSDTEAMLDALFGRFCLGK